MHTGIYMNFLLLFIYDIEKWQVTHSEVICYLANWSVSELERSELSAEGTKVKVANMNSTQTLRQNLRLMGVNL